MASTPTEPPPTPEQIADVALHWLRTQYPDPRAAESAELHDRRLARVVQNFRAGDISAAAVTRAVREWRPHFTDTLWLDGSDAELIRLIDRLPVGAETGDQQ